MNRRHFLLGLGLSVAGRAVPGTLGAAIPAADGELAADVVVLGGGLGGCAAALAAVQAGKRVILTEETDWVGGQLTSQAVPPDENQYIESFGGSTSFLKLRADIRQYYRDHYPLKPAARTNPRLNPGGGWVSRLCHEPKVALAVLENWLRPANDKGQLQILLETKLVAADVDGDRVKSVLVHQGGKNFVLRAPYFLDATELGDLLPAAKVEFVQGAEAQKDTGEPHGEAEAMPHVMQGITCCFAIDHLPGEDHRIPKPADYEFWKSHIPASIPPFRHPLLSWHYGPGATLFGFDPEKEKSPNDKPNLWTYRRILQKSQFSDGTFKSDISLINWGQNDYFLGPIFGGTPEENHQHLTKAKSLSLSLLYWLQHDAPRFDSDKTGWPGLRLRKDVVGTADGLAKHPYIRESRRIKAEFTVLEQHISEPERRAATRSGDLVKPYPFPDSVGIGLYLYMDLHPRTGGRGGKGGPIVPFQIPLGALIPVRVNNLLPACKNLGVTQLTNGCYRMHPIEWNVGESAGYLAAFCLDRKVPPRQVRNDRTLLSDYQRVLEKQGVRLTWPDSVYKPA
jgi:hypothetical protein